MLEQMEECNVSGVQPLMSPETLKNELPLGVKAAETVARGRGAIRDVIHGRDRRRLVVIAGPCSIHDSGAALEYARRLEQASEALRGELIVVMRTYFEKPRTTVGWKGLLHDPHLDGSHDVAAGLLKSRSLLVAINELGVPCGGEILNAFTPQYVGDLLSWGSIGARTVESQPHRQLASGLSMPIGFKNGTDGRLDVAVNATLAAGQGDSFLGLTPDGRAAVVRTSGNPDRHLVLRGGAGSSNYGPEDVAAAAQAMVGVAARPILVDCSHGNSNGKPEGQAVVAREIVRQFRGGQSALMGLLVESHLRAGSQRWERGVGLHYGVSITDACIGWDETEALLHEVAEGVRTRG